MLMKIHWNPVPMLNEWIDGQQCYAIFLQVEYRKQDLYSNKTTFSINCRQGWIASFSLRISFWWRRSILCVAHAFFQHFIQATVQVFNWDRKTFLFNIIWFIDRIFWKFIDVWWQYEGVKAIWWYRIPIQ